MSINDKINKEYDEFINSLLNENGTVDKETMLNHQYELSAKTEFQMIIDSIDDIEEYIDNYEINNYNNIVVDTIMNEDNLLDKLYTNLLKVDPNLDEYMYCFEDYLNSKRLITPATIIKEN